MEAQGEGLQMLVAVAQPPYQAYIWPQVVCQLVTSLDYNVILTHFAHNAQLSQVRCERERPNSRHLDRHRQGCCCSTSLPLFCSLLHNPQHAVPGAWDSWRGEEGVSRVGNTHSLHVENLLLKWKRTPKSLDHMATWRFIFDTTRFFESFYCIV